MFNKIVICDPVCIQVFGHNLNAQGYYRDYLSGYANRTICVGSRHLDEDVADQKCIMRIFDHVYNRDIPAVDPLRDLLQHSINVQKDATRLLKSNLVDVIKIFEIGGSDALFFPSVDFWSIAAICAMADELQAVGNPAIFMRFIGVMENACHGLFQYPLDEVVAMLKAMAKKGIRISISAETPAYARHLQELTGMPVLTTPYPEVSAPLPLPETDQIVQVACPGSARGDKGYFMLHEIFSAIRHRDPDQRIRFLLQRLPDRDNIHHLNYLAHLYSIPGVTIFPSVLEMGEIEDIYRNSSIILTPYETHIYKLRGSAVTMESISYGRPLVALSGTAFSEQIEYYEAGTVCQSVNEMVDAIFAYAAKPNSEIKKSTDVTRSRFFRDVDKSYKEWLTA